MELNFHRYGAATLAALFDLEELDKHDILTKKDHPKVVWFQSSNLSHSMT